MASNAVEAAAKAIRGYYDPKDAWENYEGEAREALLAALPVLTEGLAEVIDAAERSTRTGSRSHRQRVVADAVIEHMRSQIEEGGEGVSNYTPSVNAVRESYAGVRHPEVGTVRAYEEFDGWLAAELRKAKAEALREAGRAWLQGGWGSTPRRSDRVADRMAASQYAGDWMLARADELEGDDRG